MTAATMKGIDAKNRTVSTAVMVKNVKSNGSDRADVLGGARMPERRPAKNRNE